eukprot:5306953-Pyramimonas_sp.AAC.1
MPDIVDEDQVWAGSRAFPFKASGSHFAGRGRSVWLGSRRLQNMQDVFRRPYCSEWTKSGISPTFLCVLRSGPAFFH